MLSVITKLDDIFASVLKPLAPVLLLISRLWVAWVFFRAGQTKIASWDSTLYLFEYEYQVPVLPWEMAAYLGTAAELILPLFLLLGLLTRPAAFALFVFNIVAVVSYPALWDKGFFDHQMWGVMLLVTTVWGPGLLALDNKLKQRG
ncbi:DoxX family protein [Enterovibrio sp. 27052020O]|uniref:DoxX family protein n=1 Tax=Enterovibrio sp. 27052020O TaxID=3241166 RepID=UPI00388EBE2C